MQPTYSHRLALVCMQSFCVRTFSVYGISSTSAEFILFSLGFCVFLIFKQSRKHIVDNFKISSGVYIDKDSTYI